MTIRSTASLSRPVAGRDEPTLRPIGSRGLDVWVNPRRVARLLGGLVLGIVLVGAAANVAINQVAPGIEHPLARVMLRLDLGHEPSVPAWCSSLALLTSALLLGLAALSARRSGAPYVRHWTGLAVLFVLLALDEAVVLREPLSRPLGDALDTAGVPHFASVIPDAALTLAVGLGCGRFLLHLAPRTRRLFVLAGGVFVGGAIGMGLIAGIVVEAYSVASIQHTAAQTVEALLETLGIVIFIYALLEHLSHQVGAVTFRCAPPGHAPTPWPGRVRAAALDPQPTPRSRRGLARWLRRTATTDDRAQRTGAATAPTASRGWILEGSN